LDIATLGLRVDASGAISALGNFAAVSGKTARAAEDAQKSTGKLSDAQGRSAPVAGSAAAAQGRVAAATQRTTAAQQAAERATNQLNRAIALLGGALSVRELVAYADTWNLIEGRISLVTNSTRQMGVVQAEVFNIAQNARVGFEATAGLYTRVARNADTLGASQRDVLTVTEAINKAFIVSGAAVSEIDGATRQLTQAFASGTLRGEELNSVLENAPRLAEAIARGMGIQVGQLRKLGAEGKLTSREVFDAIKSQSEAIQDEFTRMPTTVGQSMVVLRNEVMRFIGAGDNATGISKALANAILSVSKNLGTLAAAITGVAAGYVIYTNAARIAAFWTAAVAAAQTIAAYVSLASQVRNVAAAMALMSMATKGVVALLTGPAGLAIALGAVIAWLVNYRSKTQDATKANDEFAASLAGLSATQLQVAESDLQRRQFEAQREMERLRAAGRQTETVTDPRAPVGVDVFITRETEAYRTQREELERVNTQLSAIEIHRQNMAELDLRPTATGGNSGLTNQQMDMVRMAEQAAALARLEGDAQARLAIEYDAVNKAIEARRELAGDALRRTLAAIEAERRANLSALTTDVRRTNEDAEREARQAAELAKLEGAAQEQLSIQYAAVNREIAARRNLAGNPELLAETIAAIERERQSALAALRSSAALEERAASVERVTEAERELAAARAQSVALVTGIDGRLVVERGNAEQRVRINAEADAEILKARKRLAAGLEALGTGVIASIERQRELRLETLEVVKAAEQEAERLQQVASVLEDFRGRVASSFNDLFEGVFTRGLDGFRAFFASVHQMLARMVAEMLTRTVMARIGNSIAGSLARVFGNMGTSAPPSPTATTMHNAGGLMLLASNNMKQAAGMIAGVKVGVSKVAGSTEATPVMLEGMTIEARESWASTAAKYLGPAIAGFAAGALIGNLTRNRAVGAMGGAAGGALSGAMVGSALGPGGALIGAGIGAITGAIGGFMSSNRRREEAEARTRQVMIQNSNRLAELRQSLDGQIMGAARLEDAGAMVNRIIRAIGPGGARGGGIDALSDIDVSKAFRGEADRGAIFELERTYGVSFRELAAIARETGIELFDSAGKLVPGALAQLAQAIGYTVEQMTKFSNSIEDQTTLRNAYNKLFDVPDTPDRKLGDAYDMLAKNAPALLEQFGLGNLDLSTQGGRDVLLKGLQDIFTLISSGQLTPELLGAFGDKNGLLAAILGAKDGLDAFRDTLGTVTTDFPRAMDVLLYEQRHGTGAGSAATTATPPKQSVGAAVAEAKNAIVIQGGMHVSIAAAPGESGENLLRKIEDAAADRVARGGYVYIPGATAADA
jgi:tape measure domain-containing protein